MKLTAKQAAKIIGCSFEHLAALARQGSIPAFKDPLFGYWVFEKKDVTAYSTARKKTAKKGRPMKGDK